MLKRKLLKLLPYLAAIIMGGIFYFLTIFIDERLYDLFINIAAAFFAIPLLYFFYETAESFSHKKLDKEIFDYAKMQVDSELLSILNQLRKIVYTLKEKDFSSETVNRFLSLKKEDLENQLKDNKYLGFQVFKHWGVNEKGLHELLKNPFILERMEDEQIISIISIFKSLGALEAIQQIDELYLETEEIAKGYKVQSGIDMNPENEKSPDRYVLLKHLTEDKFIVYDFGDIPKYNLKKCLKYYKINNKLIRGYAEFIFDLLKDINNWLDATGREFLIDSKIFKVRDKQIV
ncbi:hypothetical protein BMS3Abin15_00380 [bacterium BMS3Abin15]|nr:hypothetical protein BMS3Abin15_00380 [bacterium BMS3Abin15]